MYGGSDYPDNDKSVVGKGWDGWYPQRGMIGNIVWTWDPSWSYEVIVLVQIEQYYVPIGIRGIQQFE